MKTVEIKFTKTADLFMALIDDKKLKFTGGVATRDLKENIDYALTWFVRGAPGSTYTIEVAAPPDAKFKHAGTIDASTKDAGLHWIRVGTAAAGGGK
jgi:hypothetical protein